VELLKVNKVTFPALAGPGFHRQTVDGWKQKMVTFGDLPPYFFERFHFPSSSRKNQLFYDPSRVPGQERTGRFKIASRVRDEPPRPGIAGAEVPDRPEDHRLTKPLKGERPGSRI